VNRVRNAVASHSSRATRVPSKRSRPAGVRIDYLTTGLSDYLNT
jgi:hypothetical protein